MEKLFKFSGGLIQAPSNENFQLHLHESYEVLLFLKGDTRYIVEENIYSLYPGDMIIIRKGQMHRAYHNSPTDYDRIIFRIYSDFFKAKSCPEYEQAFLDHHQASKIAAETVHSCGLYDAFLRVQKYSDNFKNQDTPVIHSVATEILYLINNISTFSVSDIPNPQLNQIIRYLNENYTYPISLDALAEKFHLSKYHLCHTFLKGTGLTVFQYITNKRLTKANELIASGYTINDAALTAGFSSYMSYHRARKKICFPSLNEKPM